MWTIRPRALIGSKCWKMNLNIWNSWNRARTRVRCPVQRMHIILNTNINIYKYLNVLWYTVLCSRRFISVVLIVNVFYFYQMFGVLVVHNDFFGSTSVNEYWLVNGVYFYDRYFSQDKDHFAFTAVIYLKNWLPKLFMLSWICANCHSKWIKKKLEGLLC